MKGFHIHIFGSLLVARMGFIVRFFWLPAAKFQPANDGEYLDLFFEKQNRNVELLLKPEQSKIHITVKTYDDMTVISESTMMF